MYRLFHPNFHAFDAILEINCARQLSLSNACCLSPAFAALKSLWVLRLHARREGKNGCAKIDRRWKRGIKPVAAAIARDSSVVTRTQTKCVRSNIGWKGIHVCVAAVSYFKSLIQVLMYVQVYKSLCKPWYVRDRC